MKEFLQGPKLFHVSLLEALIFKELIDKIVEYWRFV